MELSLFLNFLAYLGTGAALLAVGTLLFVVATREKEFALIKEGNLSAALSLGGKVFGLSFVLGAAVANSVNLLDMVIWGVVGIVAQIVLYYVAELVTVKFSISQAIKEDNKSVGTLLLLLSLSIGWLIAQSLTY